MNPLKIMDELLRDFFKSHRPPKGTGLGFRNYGRNRRSPEHALDEVEPGAVRSPYPTQPPRSINFAQAQ